MAEARAAAEIDQALFVGDSWFCLDARNVRVPGVHPGSLTAALHLIGQGRIATVVGRLRPQVAGIDIDAGGGVGDQLHASLLAWCAERDLWTLARPSGGGAGRWHVLCLPGPHSRDLAAYVDELRTQYQLPAKAVDLRQHLRPLSAPHRTGALCPRPPGLRAAHRALQAALGIDSPPARRTGRRPTPSRAAYTPTARPQRPLPDAWQRYLTTGEPPTTADGWTDRSRSTAERVATFWLVVTGHDEAAAWTAICASHPAAFSKARERGRAWWRRYVWADAGQAADSWLSGRPARSPSPATSATLPATNAARAALDQEWLSWGRDERHALRVVLEVLLGRMDRTGSTTVPCPERDLLIDTPLRSRTTVRQALRRLTELGYGQRLATFTPAGTDPDEKSHTFALDRRFTDVPKAVVRLLGPPQCHTPPPPALHAPGLWRLLGLPARHAYLAVLTHSGSLSQDLAAGAGLGNQENGQLSPAQRRTLEAHLRTLAHLGLVEVDADGRWTAHPEPQLPDGTVKAADRQQQQLIEQITLERHDYHHRRRATVSWTRQRAAVLAQAARRNRARQRAWWDALDPIERERRHTEGRRAFAQSSTAAQVARKAQLADQRRRAGVDEEQRRVDWIAAQPAEDYARRVVDATARYAGLAPPLQAAAAAAWQRHRDTYGLTRRQPHHHRLVATSPATDPHHAPEGQLSLL